MKTNHQRSFVESKGYRLNKRFGGRADFVKLTTHKGRRALTREVLENLLPEINAHLRGVRQFAHAPETAWVPEPLDPSEDVVLPEKNFHVEDPWSWD